MIRSIDLHHPVLADALVMWAAVAFSPVPATAGGTPATATVADELITVAGSQSDPADDDWISAFTDPMGDGLDTDMTGVDPAEQGLEPNRNAVAAIAPAWLSDLSRARTLGDRMFRHVFQLEAPSVGDALLRALESAAAGEPEEHLRGYPLIGDPATEIQRRPALPPSCTEVRGGVG